MDLFVGMARAGEFDANDALFAAMQAGLTSNAGDVAAAALTDLSELGYLDRVLPQLAADRFRLGRRPPGSLD